MCTSNSQVFPCADPINATANVLQDTFGCYLAHFKTKNKKRLIGRLIDWSVIRGKQLLYSPSILAWIVDRSLLRSFFKKLFRGAVHHRSPETKSIDARHVDQPPLDQRASRVLLPKLIPLSSHIKVTRGMAQVELVSRDSINFNGWTGVCFVYLHQSPNSHIPKTARFSEHTIGGINLVRLRSCR